VGIADTEKGEVPESQGLSFEVETLYEEEVNAEESRVSDNGNGKHSLIDVKGIGAGTAKNLIKVGVGSVSELVSSDPEQIASKISGVSSKMVLEWQNNAKALLSA
jgi:predicted flap endonuclease-1-like 5' DNA nuclease